MMIRLLLKVTIVDEEEEILNINDQAGELLATFEMFERNGCEGNNMVKSHRLIHHDTHCQSIIL